MIEVGTKLRSIRSGKVVEVLELLSGAKKVKFEDGTIKVLNDSNVARWYDEVKEAKAQAKAEPKAATKVETVGETLNKMYQPKQASKKKEKVAKAEPVGTKLKQQFEEIAKEKKLNLDVMKRYSLLHANAYKISQVHFKRKSICCQLKSKDIFDSFKNYVVKYPDNFKLSYGYEFKISDEATLNKFFESVEEIIKSKKENK